MKHSVKTHLNQIKDGVVLISKAYGARKYGYTDDEIFGIAWKVMLAPFIFLFVALWYEGKYVIKPKLSAAEKKKKNK